MNNGTKVAVGLAALVTGILVGKRKDSTVPDSADIFPSPRVENARQNVVDAAMGEIGQQDPAKYWEGVMPPGEYSAAQIEQYAQTRDWCGGFALWCLKQAGLAPDLFWEDGKGFCYKLPQTTDPQPGDIAFFATNGHQAIVVQVSGGVLTSVDGNLTLPGQPVSPGPVAIRERSVDKVTAFYSIGGLVKEALSV
jgi:CHAP domain-containing protein